MDLSDFVRYTLLSPPYRRDDDTYTHVSSGVKIKKDHGLTVVYPFHATIPVDLCQKIYPLLEESRLVIFSLDENTISVSMMCYEYVRKEVMITHPYVVENVWYSHKDRTARMILFGKDFIEEVPDGSVVLACGYESIILFRTEEERLAFILSQ